MMTKIQMTSIGKTYSVMKRYNISPKKYENKKNLETWKKQGLDPCPTKSETRDSHPDPPPPPISTVSASCHQPYRKRCYDIKFYLQSLVIISIDILMRVHKNIFGPCILTLAVQRILGNWKLQLRPGTHLILVVVSSNFARRLSRGSRQQKQVKI